MLESIEDLAAFLEKCIGGSISTWEHLLCLFSGPFDQRSIIWLLS